MINNDTVDAKLETISDGILVVSPRFSGPHSSHFRPLKTRQLY